MKKLDELSYSISYEAHTFTEYDFLIDYSGTVHCGDKEIGRFTAYYLDLYHARYHHSLHPVYAFDETADTARYYAPLFYPAFADLLAEIPDEYIELTFEIDGKTYYRDTEIIEYLMWIKQDTPDRFSPRVQDLNGHRDFTDVLILQTLELIPEFRGRGVGLKITKDVIRLLSSYGDMCILMIYPMQFSGAHDPETDWNQIMQYDQMLELPSNVADLTIQEIIITRKLMNHFDILGFREIYDGLPYMILNLENDIPVDEEIMKRL